MGHIEELMSWIGGDRRLSWPVLFILGILAGLILGITTGLPNGAGYAAEIRRDNLTFDLDTETPLSPALPVSAFSASDRLNDRGLRGIQDQGRDLPGLSEEEEVLAAFEGTRYGVRRPQIAIVIDDLGLDEEAYRAVNALPGPLTLSFLPYGEEAQNMLNRMAPEHEAMLHLPMEPLRRVRDAGPDMLEAGADENAIREQFASNLRKLYGYRGVNNHTGSRFTSDSQSMAVLLEQLHYRGLYFLDSVTTGAPVSSGLAEGTDWRVLERDIFLDADYPNVTTDSVKAQLGQLERIARRDGYAIAIGHPYRVTLETLAPWLVTAEARGFDLVTVGDLVATPAPATLARLR